MLKKMLENNIQVINEAKSWEDAINIAAKPLLEGGNIKEEYINSMVENVVKNGPYIVIMPGVAIPHARPECGVINTGISLLKLKNSIKFPKDKDVELLIVLAANDNDMHLEIISKLTDILMDDDIFENIMKSNDREEIVRCLS